MLLAGDVGGTKTILAVYSREAGPYAPVAKTEVHSADYGSLTAIAREFLTQVKVSADRGCFSVAGPVMDGRAKITNLPWVIDESIVAKELKLESVHLMNDLEAIAFAVPEPAGRRRAHHQCRSASPEGHHRRHRAGDWAGRIVPDLGGIPLHDSRHRRRPL